MIVVFICGPYRAPSEYQVLCNIRNAEALALRVWKAGAACHCPHKNTAFFGGAADDAVWLDGAKEILSRCDVVLCVNEWETSEGSRDEVTLASELNKPVFDQFEEFEKWLESSDQRAR